MAQFVQEVCQRVHDLRVVRVCPEFKVAAHATTRQVRRPETDPGPIARTQKDELRVKYAAPKDSNWVDVDPSRRRLPAFEPGLQNRGISKHHCAEGATAPHQEWQ
jgi:hypothetical protein